MFLMLSAPYEPPDLVTAYNTSSTSLVVKWSHVPTKYFGGKPIGYNVYYSSYWDDGYQFVSVSYTTNTATLTNLQVYTMYIVAVAAVSSGGEGPLESGRATTGENKIFFLPCLVNWFTFLRRSLHSSIFTC